MDYVEVILFKCVHCDEYHTDDLEMMDEHLEKCLANPNNKACLMCKNLTQYNDLIDGKPLRVYKCNKLNKVLDDLDMALTGATCFEERDIRQVVKQNTDMYMDYMQRVVEKIQKATE